MDLESSFTRMVECMMATGCRIKWKVMASFIINLVCFFVNISGKIAYDGEWIQDQFTGLGVLYN